MRIFSLCISSAIALLLGAATARADGPLEIVPAEIRFRDPLEGRQLLVQSGDADATSAAQFTSSAPAVATVDERGYVRPASEGTATITALVDGASRSVVVTVESLTSARTVDFAVEIEPVLNRFGCNSGGCHGKASGQNGFRLSLFGSNWKFDQEAIAVEGRGRRVFPAAPEQSLFLRKATGQSPHGGGRRIDFGSEPYELIRRWIAQGAPPASPDAPHVERLSVQPAQRVMRAGQKQQLVILAHYSDGAVRDVTRQAQYGSNLDPVATVDEAGLILCGDEVGEAAVMARYMGQVAAFQVLVPVPGAAAQVSGRATDGPSAPSANTTSIANGAYIDQLVQAKWTRLGLVPSGPCDDATYLRRVTVDLCGRLPTVDETRAFLDDASAERRDRLVDRLLTSPDYPAFFALRWGSILRNSNLAGADRAAYAFHNWIKEMVARNRPYDEFVRGIVAASGEWQDAPAINWYWQSRDDQLHQVTADTAQVFLGLRLQCARCHHHPYERWGQDDYYGLLGFYTRLGRKAFGEPPPYFASSNVTTGEQHPLKGGTPEPKFLGGDYARFTPEEDPRHALVDWMARPENPYFARALVNRLWGHFLGRGLVDPVDDMRETNPPSNPELLDALAKDFVEHKLDVRHMIRRIVLSRPYQLDSAPTEQNKADRQNYARFYARRLIAEVLLDAVDQACGTKSSFGGVSATARAVDLPHESFGSYFLDAFDRPRRVTSCECERSAGATLAQVLLLSNSDEIENKIGDGNGRVAQQMKNNMPLAEAVEEIYLAALSRRPTEAELAASRRYVERQEDRHRALEDVLWAVLNSREFMFNR